MSNWRYWRFVSWSTVGIALVSPFFWGQEGLVAALIYFGAMTVLGGLLKK